MPRNTGNGKTGALGALNDAIFMEVGTHESVGCQIYTGNLVGTVTPEVSYDAGVTYVATQFYNPATAVFVATVNAFPVGLTILLPGGVTHARVRVSAYTSGTSNVELHAVDSPSAIRQVGVSGTSAAAGDVAHDAVDSGNPVKMGAQARATNPTAVQDADRVNITADLIGRQIVSPYTNPENIVDGNANSTGTGDTSVIAAQGAGIRLYITSVFIDNPSATDSEVILKDGATTKLRIPAPKASGAVIQLPVPLRLTANTAFNFASVTAVTTMYVSAVGFKANI